MSEPVRWSSPTDWLIGPSPSRVVLIAIQVVGALVAAGVWWTGGSPWLALVAWDVAAGALANTTPSTSGFYASKPRSAHVAFIVVHALHVFLSAYLGGQTPLWALAVYVTTVVGVVAVRSVAVELATPVALGVVLVGATVIPALPGWPAFVAVFLLKIVWAFGVCARRGGP